MSALRFARVIANSVHECAPDHSTHIIGAGQLRKAVAEMEALYSALERLEHNFDLLLRGKPVRDVAETQCEVTAALAQARGDLVDPLEQVRL